MSTIESLPVTLSEQLSALHERVWLGLQEKRDFSDVCVNYSHGLDTLVGQLEVHKNVCVFAIGSWARQTVAPYSDLDLVIIGSESQAQGLLRPLWDAGLRVGHSVRTVAEVNELIRSGDLPTITSMLDARGVVGNFAPLQEIQKSLSRALSGGRSRDVADKLADERRERHRRFGDSIYLLEPNIKQGIGGLRDQSIVDWTLRICEMDSAGPSLWLTKRQKEALEESAVLFRRLQFMIRKHVGRATDLLSFENQEVIGPFVFPDAPSRPGVKQSAVAPAVEQLMKTYFRNAREVVRIQSALSDQLRHASRKMPRVRKVDHTFSLFNERLTTTEARAFEHRQADAIRLFRVAAQTQCKIHWHALEKVTESVAIGSLAQDRRAASYFLEALVDPTDRSNPSLLEQMHYCGGLSAVIPEWAPCTCRVQHDLYHRFTVDQHQLLAVAMWKQLCRGELTEKFPLASELAVKIGPSKELGLAILLHDAAKPLGKGHAERGGQMAEIVAPRLGFSAEETALTAFLIRQHLTMYHISQRRDLSDESVIKRFAGKMGSCQKLEYLYVLSVVDSAMTSPDNLSSWKLQLLSQLFQQAYGALQSSPRTFQSAEKYLLQQENIDEAERFLQVTESSFLGSTGPQLHRVYTAWHKALSSGDPQIDVWSEAETTELVVCAHDRQGLLADITGVLASNGVGVLSASTATDKSGQTSWAVDRFLLLGWPRNKMVRKRVMKEIEAAVIQKEARDFRPKRLPSNRPTVSIETKVTIDNNVSGDWTVVEIFTVDKPYVLHAICLSLSQMGFDIKKALIATEGLRVMDVFYIASHDGQKVREGHDHIAKELERTLDELS